jgi:phenylpyruvate tautomerase PptA (4-oxalocrotonate tautomerase family)
MPLLKATLRKGVLTTEQKQALADALTDIILEGEVGHISENGRRAAHVVFHEIDADTNWFVGGQPAATITAPGLIIFEVVYPEAATDAAVRSRLHREINAAAVHIVLGPDAPANGLAKWVHVREVPEGSWGVRGNTIGIHDIAGGPEVPPARIAYADALLEAGRRLRAAHGFPTAIATA